MNKILLFFICCAFTFLISCKENNKNTPQLNEDQFTKMLIDIHIIDGTLESQNIYRSGDNYRPSYYYNSIFQKYNITRDQFDSCVSYYSNNTKRFTQIYDVIIDSLNRLETQYRIEVKNKKLEQDTVNLWTKKQDWRVPEKDKNQVDFAIPIKEKGIYTIKASIKIFKDDQTDQPKLEAYFWKQDSLGEEHKVSFMPRPIAKEMKFNTYELSLSYPDSSYTELRGNLFAGENDLVEFTQHFEIKDIIIFNPQIRPDSLQVIKELEQDVEQNLRRVR
ncbi:hypothetical protein BZG01_14040 [Labilibaculum manganireducens]|uniref:DUF4296 domain-containing protein n=1 Tax=Labilibaculum manganireducens TaxID=1940525 RepID=A0A2N3I2W8_9BACT|nr:DUF4296 domain-containing protein [Labilibaculum manganireducens]PKQ64649.1 hypothetical protein BZG01_14040 [Labilibaculum manganireducens]